jgi:2-polyprenyl-3-methyl-5-hydroxy-6-metoxy-1,4-benzoquinol methylase
MTDRASALGTDLLEVVCPLCDAGESRVYVYAPSHYGPDRLKVTQCKKCGMVFTNPQSQSYEERVRDRGVLSRFFDPSRLDSAKRLAAFHLSYLSSSAPGKRVLDFGCGEGAFVQRAQEEGWEAVGVDLNEGLVEAANEYWRSGTLHYKSIDQLVATGWQFDAIYSNQVFEHLRRPVDVARALVEMLAPRGVIYIEVPNALRLQERLDRGRTLDPTSHFNHFTAKTLTTLMERIGCVTMYASGAPGLIKVWHKTGAGRWATPLGRITRRVLPGIGGGACVLGRRL